jgi:hypothetical protein
MISTNNNSHKMVTCFLFGLVLLIVALAVPSQATSTLRSTKNKNDFNDAQDDDPDARRRSLNGAVPCSTVIGTKLVPAVEDFENFPCGTYPFDAAPEDALVLDCTYYTLFDEYECVTNGPYRANEVIAAAKEQESLGNFKNPQPCTAAGYNLDGKVRTWWWICSAASD